MILDDGIEYFSRIKINLLEETKTIAGWGLMIQKAINWDYIKK